MTKLHISNETRRGAASLPAIHWCDGRPQDLSHPPDGASASLFRSFGRGHQGLDVLLVFGLGDRSGPDPPQIPRLVQSEGRAQVRFHLSFRNPQGPITAAAAGDPRLSKHGFINHTGITVPQGDCRSLIRWGACLLKTLAHVLHYYKSGACRVAKVSPARDCTRRGITPKRFAPELACRRNAPKDDVPTFSDQFVGLNSVGVVKILAQWWRRGRGGGGEEEEERSLIIELKGHARLTCTTSTSSSSSPRVESRAWLLWVPTNSIALPPFVVWNWVRANCDGERTFWLVFGWLSDHFPLLPPLFALFFFPLPPSRPNCSS